MKYYKFAILLVALMILGTFSGAYAINTASHNNKTAININNSKNNTPTDGTKTLYVANNGTDKNDGLTPSKPKRNIIIAIYMANPGDTIVVAPGTYKENFQIDKNITIIGNKENNTIIDGTQSEICIHIESGVTATITNFTIKNGKYRDKSYVAGGGICNAGTLTLKNSTIMNNIGYYGGGIKNIGTMNMNGVTIKNNTAELSGAGIITDDDSITTIENSTITNNTAGYCAGGIYSAGKLITIRNSKITNNSALDDGGGIFNCHYLTVEDSIISDNSAGQNGGGIFTCNKITSIYGVTITNNKAKDGGGIYNGLGGEKTQIYIDDLTKMINNRPNNYQGNPYIPA